MQPIPGSAEFPNDNPLLHQGAVWICTRVRGAPRAILRASLPPEPEPEPELTLAAVPEPEPVALAPEPVLTLAAVPASAPEPEPVAVVAEPAIEPAPTPEPDPDPFADYVRAVAEVVLEAGFTRAAAAIPAFFEGSRFIADAFDKATTDLLVSRGFAESDAAGIVPTAGFRATVSVWSRVLRGEPVDLSDCGASMLDQWTAEFVATLLGASSARSDELRRQLRRKGVAAFGMLARAA